MYIVSPRASAPPEAGAPQELSALSAKEGRAFDEAFLDALAAREEDTVALERMAISKSQQQQLRSFLLMRIDEQTSALSQVHEWRDSGF